MNSPIRDSFSHYLSHTASEIGISFVDANEEYQITMLRKLEEWPMPNHSLLRRRRHNADIYSNAIAAEAHQRTQSRARVSNLLVNNIDLVQYFFRQDKTGTPKIHLKLIHGANANDY